MQVAKGSDGRDGRVPAVAGPDQLDGLARGARAVIDAVEFRAEADPVAARLVELGFVAGEVVQMVAHGPFGADTLAVRLGGTRFALRRDEARRVRLMPAVDTPAA